jgi:hypothetical protein
MVTVSVLKLFYPLLLLKKLYHIFVSITSENINKINASSRFGFLKLLGFVSEYQPFFNRLDHLLLVDAQAFHQPSELLRCQFFQFLRSPWPLVLSIFETLVQKNISIGIPIKRLDSVTASSAEEEQRIRLRIHMEGILDYGCKTIDSAPEITVAHRKIDLLGFGQIKHRRSPPEELR